ncbi:MAG: peptidoglycan-binding domain-containing protein [Terriglobia bacterium]
MKKLFTAWALLAGIVCGSAAPLRADTTAQQKSSSTSQQKSHTASKDPTHPTSTSSSQQSSARRSAKHRPPSKAALVAAGRRRRGAMRPESDRIEQIQQALAKSGYLSVEPTGRWDDQTREAMRRYQADNGFPVTGLPEAKSLMKLGLGPHPLPPELDTSNVAKAGTTNGNSEATPNAPAAQPNSPPPAIPQP